MKQRNKWWNKTIQWNNGHTDATKTQQNNTTNQHNTTMKQNITMNQHNDTTELLKILQRDNNTVKQWKQNNEKTKEIIKHNEMIWQNETIIQWNNETTN